MNGRRLGSALLVMCLAMASCALVDGGEPWPTTRSDPSGGTPSDQAPIDLSSLPGWIVFGSSRNDPDPISCDRCDLDLYVMRPDGSHLTRLTSGHAADRGASVSPDGAQIAFHRDQPSDAFGEGTLMVMRRDGSGLTDLHVRRSIAGRPTWSPDGRRLVYQHPISDTRGGELWSIDLPSGRERAVDPLPVGDTLHSDAPSLSSRGDLAFIRIDLTTQRSTICISPAVGGPASCPLPWGTYVDAHWSPDGSQIAFTRAVDENTDVYVMAADGSGVRRLTDDPEPDLFPSWSPDGMYIAFTTGRDLDGWAIAIMRADGTGEVVLPHVSDAAPSWSPG